MISRKLFTKTLLVTSLLSILSTAFAETVTVVIEGNGIVTSDKTVCNNGQECKITRVRDN
jgi:hypothetical protein